MRSHIICLTPSLHPCQGHILAVGAIGDIYYCGKGVAKDYPRAMTAYKVGAEGGDALCQHQVGMMYRKGRGVAVDYQQARAWFEKAAAQDDPHAVGQLGVMYADGDDVTPSWRRARELYQRVIELGSSQAVGNMQTLTNDIQEVSFTSSLSHHFPYRESSLISPSPSLPRPHSTLPPRPSGWRSTARAAPT